MATDAHIRYRLKLIALRVLYSAASAMLMFIHQNHEFEHLKDYWCRFVKERTERIEQNVESVVKLEGDETTLIHLWYEETRAEVLELWTQLIAVDGTEVLFEAKSKSYVGAIQKVIEKTRQIMLKDQLEDESLSLIDYYQAESIIRDRTDQSSEHAQRTLNTIKRVRRFEAGFFNLWHPSLLCHQGWKDAGDAMSLRIMSKAMQNESLTLLTPISYIEDSNDLVEAGEESMLDTTTSMLAKLEALERKCKLPIDILQDSEMYCDLMYFETEEITVSASKKIIPNLNSQSLRKRLVENSFRISLNADTGKVVIKKPGAVNSFLRLRRKLGISMSWVSVKAGPVAAAIVDLRWETQNENIDKELCASKVQSDLEDALYTRRGVEGEDWSPEDIELTAMYMRSLFERGLLQSGKIMAHQVYGEYSCWRLIYRGETRSTGKNIRYHADRPHLLTNRALLRSLNGKIVVPLENRSVKIDFKPRMDRDHTGGVVWHVGSITECNGEELAQTGEYSLVPMDNQPIAIGYYKVPSAPNE